MRLSDQMSPAPTEARWLDTCLVELPSIRRKCTGHSTFIAWDSDGRHTMNELTKEQADDLRRTAEYLTLQMRLTPHPTERSRIRAMADTVDFVAERIDALVSARSAEAVQPRHSISQLLRRAPLGNHK
jgi:hypothetical protein